MDIRQCPNALPEGVASQKQLTGHQLPWLFASADARLDVLAVGLPALQSHPEPRPRPVDLEPFGCRTIPCRRQIVAPRPLADTIDEACTDGIQHDVPDQFQEMSFLLNNDGVETTLEQMANAI